MMKGIKGGDNVKANDDTNGATKSKFFGFGGKKKSNKPEYEGKKKDGKAWGKGRCTWPNGDTYDGDWQDNRMHGTGVFVWKQKSCRYEGEYKDGLSHGKGKLFLDGEGQYEGAFVEGKKHGTGIWTGPDGMVYDGSYEKDWRHGVGTLKMTDDSSYSGEWKEGKFDGEGVWTWRDGRIFKGLFANDHPVEGLLEYDGASRPVMWDTRTGTFVSPDQANGLMDAMSPRRWSGGDKGKSLAADAETPPAASVGLWGICTSSRKDGIPTSARTHNTANSYDDEEIPPPLPVKEGWCPPAGLRGVGKGGFDDHKRRFCAWAGFV